MKKILSIITLILCSSYLYSQTKTNGIGLTYGHFWAINDVEFIQNQEALMILNNFVSQSDYVGLSYEVKIPFLKNFSILSNFYYNSFDFKQEKMGDSYPHLEYDQYGNSKVINTLTKHRVTGYYSLISLDVMSKYEIPQTGFSLNCGVSLSKYESSKYENIFFIDEPKNEIFTIIAGKVYRDNGRTLVLYDAQIPDHTNYRFGLKFGASYDFDLYWMTLSPFINYDLPLTSVVSTFIDKGCTACNEVLKNPRWKVHYLNSGIDIKYWF